MGDIMLFEFDYETVMRVVGARSQVYEEHIKGVLQPKPAWLPSFIWKRLIKRLFIIKIHTSYQPIPETNPNAQ